MSVKESLYGVMNSNGFGSALLEARRIRRHEKKVEAVRSSGYHFVDRGSGSDKLCIVLAGYKEPLWDSVFSRLACAAPEDMDVCIMTSGLESEQLARIAEEHGWSYLSTEVNHLSLIQNLAIELHPSARWIFKLDEDMFLPRTFFEPLIETYELVERDSYYQPAFVSPLINVSCYGHIRLLEKCDLIDDFRAADLSDVKVTDGIHHNKRVLEDVAVARYLWGETQPVLRDVDALTSRFMAEDLSYTVCSTRYSIGAILFTRDAWEEFGKFPLTFVGSEFGLGDDEEHICHYACFTGRAMVVSENVVVGHLGYGPQTKGMLEYYAAHEDWFAMPANVEEK